MLKIKEKEISKLLDKKNLKIKSKDSNNTLNLDYNIINFFHSYVDYIKIKKILKYKTINVENINELDYINKKYISKNEPIMLGSGAFGKVYKLNEKTCVKIEKIDIQYGGYSNIERKNNELEISKICGLKNISPKLYFNEIIFNNYNSSFYYYTYMKNINGETLQKYLEKKDSHKNIKNIKKILKNKINKIHKLGYVHFDIHPGNIMIELKDNSFKNLYIIDFGITKKIKNFNSYNVGNNSIYEKDNNFIKYLLKKKYIEFKINKNIIIKLNKIYNNVINNIDNKNIENKNIENKNIIDNNILFSKDSINYLIKLIKNKDNKIIKKINSKKIEKVKNIENDNIIIGSKYKIINKINTNDFFQNITYILSFADLNKIYECLYNKNKYLIFNYYIFNNNIDYEEIKDEISNLKIITLNKVYSVEKYKILKNNKNMYLILYFKISNNINLNELKRDRDTDEKTFNNNDFKNKIYNLYNKVIKLGYNITLEGILYKLLFLVHNNKLKDILLFYDFKNPKNIINNMINYHRKTKIKLNDIQYKKFINELIKSKLVQIN
jgi:hypothetical protein